MADDFYEIAERPVDIFYGGVINCIILSFKNRPEIDAVAETEAFIRFLTDVWNKYFSDIDDVLDFVRYCTYNTGLIGRFYRVNCFLPLDNVFYFLKESNRLPNPDSFSKTWHILHKLAKLVLLEYCTEYSSDISFNLDVHVKDGRECDASDSIASYLNLEDLPNEEDCVLVFHITIIYNNNPKLLSSENFPSLTSNYINSKNEFCDSSEVTNIPKSTISPKISDSISQSPSGSNNNPTQPKDDPWEKYGAKPKTRYLQKNYFSSENQKEDKNKEISLKSPRKQRRLTSEKESLPQKPTKILTELEKIESSLQDSTQKVQALSISRSSNVTRNIAPERRFEIMNRETQRNEVTNIRNSSLRQQLSDQSLPSSSRVTKQTGSVFDNKNSFTDFFDECFSSKQTQSNKYDQIFPAPWIPQESENNSYYKKRDGRIPDVRHSQNPECSASPNKDLKNQDLPEKGATAAAHTDRRNESMVISKLFPVLEGVFATQKELDDMPEDMRQLQMKYEESIINMMKAEAMSELSSSDSNDSERMEQSLPKEQRIPEKEQDHSLQMPYIRFTPQQTRQVMAEDNDNFYTFTTYIGLQVRETLFRYELKKFFENYDFPDESSKDFPESFMKSSVVKEYYDLYHSAGLTTNTSLLEDTKSSCEANTSNTRNQATALNPDDPNSGHLAIRTFEDKMSFNWDSHYQQRVSDIENPKTTHFPETSASATSKKDKVFILDGEPVASGSSDEQCDMFFQILVQKLTENASSTQATLPHEFRAVPTSANKKYSSPEQASKYSEILNLAHVEKADAITSGDISEDEMLYDVSEESLGLSDCDSSNDEELASEFEQ